MIRKLFIFLILYFFLFIGCKHTLPQVSTEEFYKINADSTLEEIDLKLSDIAENLRLVRLETSSECIISAKDYYISDKYIIAFSQDGYYKFSSNGKFLKKILSYGKGPDEISGMFVANFYDDNKDLLYLDDENLKQKLLVYDLHLDKFVTPIKKTFYGPMGQISVLNDSLIVGKSYYSNPPYAIYFQNFDGKFISGVQNSKKRFLGPNPVPSVQISQISIADNNYRVSFNLDDTLFTLKNNHLVPYIILNFRKPRENPPNDMVKKGDRQITFPTIEPKSFIIIRVSIIDEIIWVTPTSGREKVINRYIFLNKSTGKYSEIRSFKDDISGIVQKSNDDIENLGRLDFPQFLKNGKLVKVYQPNMIKKIIEQGMVNPVITPSIKNELLNINKNLQETDNPILLIGDIKEKIRRVLLHVQCFEKLDSAEAGSRVVYNKILYSWIDTFTLRKNVLGINFKKVKAKDH